MLEVGEDYILINNNGKKVWVVIHQLASFEEAAKTV
jgi:hypothetical protein